MCELIKEFMHLVWQELAQALGKNVTIESLNIESNYLTGEGIKCIIEVLQNNTTIKELRIANQVIFSVLYHNHL
jgi:tropomodulin